MNNDGVSINDVNDTDGGGNLRQNFPAITQADLHGASLVLSGSLDTDGLSTQYRLEFFGNAIGTQDATHGEGRTYLGTTTVTTNGSGDATFSGVILDGVTLGDGDYVTATATRIETPGMVGIDDLAAYGNTSEFAANVAINAQFGTAIWSESGSSPLETSEWDGTSFGPEGTTGSLGAWRVMQGAEAPTRVERIILGVDAGGTIEGQIWDGSSWSALPINPLGTVTQTYWWGMDVAYESQSGDAVLVWTDGATVEYATWDGTSWSAVNTIGIYSGATPRQLQLAASPDADEMVLVVSDSNSRDTAYVWDGDGWGNAVTLATSSSDDRTDINVAYEQQSGDAMVVYGNNSATLRYQTWDGASWSGESVVTAPVGVTGNVRWTTIASDPNSDRIAVGVVTLEQRSLVRRLGRNARGATKSWLKRRCRATPSRTWQWPSRVTRATCW